MRRRLQPARRTAAAVPLAAALALSACSGPRPGAPAAGGSRSPQTPAAAPWNPRPVSIAALGDSITRGFDACSLPGDCPQASWATGTRPDVDSLARRLGARSRNLAVSGTRMSDLRAQAEQAAAQRPQLATVLMGANDACRPDAREMTSVAEFRTGFTSAMDALRRASPDTEVYVVSIPDLERLWSAGRSSRPAQRLWGPGVCPSMLARPASQAASDAERRTAVRDRVTAYNQVLNQVCAAFPRCRYDGGAVFGRPLAPADLSPWDWFHPSAEGQARLARLAYQRITGR